LTELGETPIPKYISRDVTQKMRSATIYAKEEGAVATAGLHFSKHLLKN
jgi:S-adenosylmethionine:tRNA ribosyltransferase-isomerase